MLARVKWASVAVLLLAAVIGAWIVSYPDRDDPKNIRYVLWKNGLSAMDLNQAVYVLGRDPDGRARLINGKTETELRDRFGVVVRPSKASPWLRRCFENSDWKRADARFIRNTSLIVVFKNGRATNSWVFKPC